MNQINFNGIEGQIIEQSEHGTHLVVKLSNRISIVDSFSNQFEWKITNDQSSGFKSFLCYIGFNSDNVKQKY